jgi:hypothetical protein
MVPPKVTTSFELAALYFIVNWARDQNVYIAQVMVAKVATVVRALADWQNDFLFSLKNVLTVATRASKLTPSFQSTAIFC